MPSRCRTARSSFGLDSPSLAHGAVLQMISCCSANSRLYLAEIAPTILPALACAATSCALPGASRTPTMKCRQWGLSSCRTRTLAQLIHPFLTLATATEVALEVSIARAARRQRIAQEPLPVAPARVRVEQTRPGRRKRAQLRGRIGLHPLHPHGQQFQRPPSGHFVDKLTAHLPRSRVTLVRSSIALPHQRTFDAARFPWILVAPSRSRSKPPLVSNLCVCVACAGRAGACG